MTSSAACPRAGLQDLVDAEGPAGIATTLRDAPANRSGGPRRAAGQESRGNCCHAKRFARTLYDVPVIRSFADKATERLSRRESVPALDPRIRRTALRKLRLLDSALSLEELRVPRESA